MDINPDHTVENAVNEVLNQWETNRSLTLKTSGSTGKPNLINLPENLLRWSVLNTTKTLHLSDERVLICISPSRVGGAMMVLRCAINNWDYKVLSANANPFEFIEKNHSHTFVSLVPYQISTILKDGVSRKKLSRFKNVLIGGAIIPIEVEKQILDFNQSSNTNFYHTYGMTETASHVALRRIIHFLPSDVFTPFDGVVFDFNSSIGAKISIPEINFSVQTNDLLEQVDGCIRYVGRTDDVVNSGGVKIHLNDLTKQLDALLFNHCIKANFFFWKEVHESWGEALILVVNNEGDLQRIVTIIRSNFDTREVPKKIYLAKRFIHTVSDKIDKIATCKKAVLIEI